VKLRLIAVLVCVGLIGSAYVSRSGPRAAPDFPINVFLSEQSEIVIEIPAGTSGSEIAQLLFENGVVKSADAFFRVAVGDKRSEKIAPGGHRISQNISARQALEQLLDPNRIPNLIRIVEGGWKSEVTSSLIEYGFTKRQIDQAFAQLVLPKGFSNPEGLLFPAQYTFASGTTAPQVVQAMVDRFTAEPIAQKLLLGSKKFSASQLLTIASIAQAEGDEKDFSKVTRVILNRLDIGMPLQMDSTVHFVKKVRGEIFLRRYGLPPGPIGSPGVAALSAALEPAIGDWLYFITVAPGDTRFTRSIDEFNSWKSLYGKNRKAGLFK